MCLYPQISQPKLGQIAHVGGVSESSWRADSKTVPDLDNWPRSIWAKQNNQTLSATTVQLGSVVDCVQRSFPSVAKVKSWSSWSPLIWQTFKGHHDFGLIFLFNLSFGTTPKDAKKVDTENENEVAEEYMVFAKGQEKQLQNLLYCNIINIILNSNHCPKDQAK